MRVATRLKRRFCFFKLKGKQKTFKPKSISKFLKVFLPFLFLSCFPFFWWSANVTTTKLFIYLALLLLFMNGKRQTNCLSFSIWQTWLEKTNQQQKQNPIYGTAFCTSKKEEFAQTSEFKKCKIFSIRTGFRLRIKSNYLLLLNWRCCWLQKWAHKRSDFRCDQWFWECDKAVPWNWINTSTI